MLVEINLPPKEEAQFAMWAARHGNTFEREALALYRTPSGWNKLAMLFLKTNALLSRITDSHSDATGGK